MTIAVVWKKDLNVQEWDQIVSDYNGHPLQSASWGQARRMSNNIIDYRWIAYKGCNPVFLVRFEERHCTNYVKIAWVPKGPIILDVSVESEIFSSFLEELKKNKFLLCIVFSCKQEKKIFSNPHQTIWVNLNDGKEKIWNKFSSQFRHSIRRSEKLGLIVEDSKISEDIEIFFRLCSELSIKKKFDLKISIAMIRCLLLNQHCSKFESHLFVAKHNKNICGGAFIIKCGENAHHFFGVKDREYNNKLRVSEALHWFVIQWAIDKKCKLYDLEGVDVARNFGVYNFKSKLKGELITFRGIEIFPLSYFINIFKYLIKFFPLRLLNKVIT